MGQNLLTSSTPFRTSSSSWLASCPALRLLPPATLSLLVLLPITTSNLFAPPAVVVVVVVAVVVIAVNQHPGLACTAGPTALVHTAAPTATTSPQGTKPLPPSPTCREAAPTVVSGYLPPPDEVGLQLLTPLKTLFLQLL